MLEILQRTHFGISFSVIIGVVLDNIFGDFLWGFHCSRWTNANIYRWRYLFDNKYTIKTFLCRVLIVQLLVHNALALTVDSVYKKSFLLI